MATLIGTDLNEVILPGAIPPTVTVLLGNSDLSEPDVIFAAGGNDTVRPGNGNDTAFLGLGDDRFIWNPGDDNDVVEGQQGVDTLEFNGANVAENIAISANGERSLFFRDVAQVTIDMDRVERIEFNALGGIDQIVVNNLTGTDVALVDLDLAGVAGTDIGDAVADGVTVAGTGGRDLITVRTFGGATVVSGLSARVEISGEDGGQDVLTIEASGGNDRISATLLTDDAMKLVVRGGSGNDVIRGGNGRDALFGDSGRDQLFGSRGNDELSGGSGNDELTGGSGADQFIFTGRNGIDRIEDFRNGTDKIRLEGYGSALNSFADLAGDIVQVGTNVHIRLGSNVSGAGTIVIENFRVAQVNAADFLF